MNDPEQILSSEDFQAHSAWVRRLARRLLDDEAGADDLVQDAWVALQSQPRGKIRDLRAWLGTVVRRTARRTKERKASRDDLTLRAVATGELAQRNAPSADQLLELEATRRLLVDAVLSLDEPYRATLILHFYAELGPSEIAGRLGVPASTIRTRLQRGLALVRARLGHRDPRTDPQMRSALLVVAESFRTTPATLRTGILVAASTARYVAAGILLVLLSLGTWWAAADRSDEPSRGLPVPDALAALAPSATAAPEVPRAEGSMRVAEPTRPALVAPSDGMWRLAIERAVGGIRGTVVAESGSYPIEGAEVRLKTSVGDVADGALLADDRAPIELRTRTRADGYFEFLGIPTGSYRIHARGPDGSAVSQSVSATTKPIPILLSVTKVNLPWRQVESFTVRTLDAGKRALSNIELHLTYRDVEDIERERQLVSNEAGLAVFPDLELGGGTLVALAPDGRAARATILRTSKAYTDWLRAKLGGSTESFPVDLVLLPTGSIAGTIEGGGGATVRAWLWDSDLRDAYGALCGEARCDADGSFEIAALPEGLYLIGVEAPAGTRANLPSPYYDRARPLEPPPSPRVVAVTAGEATRVQIDLVPSAEVQGQVLDASTHIPLGGATVRAWAGEPTRAGNARRAGVFLRNTAKSRFESASRVMRFETRTDALGRYRLSGLGAAEGWVVEVQCPGYSRELVEPLELEAGAARELVHHLVPAGGIQGVAWSSAWIGLAPEGKDCCTEVFGLSRDRDATFTLTGLAAGTYRLFALDWMDANLRAELVSIDVRAGELSWIDLRTALPHVGRGRLLHRGEPVIGATIEYTTGYSAQYSRGWTDAQGRFELGTPFPEWTGSATITAFAPSIPGALTTRFEVQDFLSANSLDRDLTLSSGELLVRVLDADGRALQGSLQIGRMNGAPENGVTSSIEGATWPLDRDGRTRFAALPLGKTRLRVRSAEGWNFAAPEVEVSGAPSQVVEVQAPQTGAVRVLVLGSNQAPVDRALTYLTVQIDGMQFEIVESRRTNEQGEVFFPHVPVGRSTVTSSINGAGSAESRETYADIEVVTGDETRVKLTMP